MALVRCEAYGHPRLSKRNAHLYAAKPYRPAGHPASALVCGLPECECSGLVWLTLTEVAEYDAGKRVFRLRTNQAKIRLE